jgi:cytochrome c-type biogenesis protein CcmH/NrfG
MKTLTSVAAYGLVPVPLMSDTPHPHEDGKRMTKEGNVSTPRLAWLPRDADERLATKEELAHIRRELRDAILMRALASVPQRSQIIEGLKTQAEAMPLWYLWLLAIVAPLTIIGSLAWLIAGVSTAKSVLGLGGIALYGTIMMQAIYGLSRRLRRGGR